MASRPAKKRRISPSEDDGQSSAKVAKAFMRSAQNWDLEQSYEDKARKNGKKKDKQSNRLPVKTADGRLQQYQGPEDDVASIDDEEWLEGKDVSDVEAEDPEPVPEEPQKPVREQIMEAKEELAKTATALNENPEENGGAFKALAKFNQSKVEAVVKLALATQLAVYKDVIPGYRIRQATEDAPEEKLSKDVRSLRSYEQALVSGYQTYVKELTKHAKSGKNQEPAKGQSLASVAITCACTLLTTVPHFNFRSELIKILVGKLSHKRVDDDFVKCLKAFETLFQEDEEGRPAMESVSLLSKMMKAREYYVDESVVNLFLHLRLLSEFSGKASKDHVERDREDDFKKPKQKKEFRTKRLRKMMKEEKSIQKDMAIADATVSHEERDRMQSDTLKLVFGTYFRALKARVPRLMGAVLEGLAKYAHLINQDFFGDLLEALKDLIRYSEADEDQEVEEDEDEVASAAADRNTTREALLCTITAFALLAGQDAHNARADLHLDLSFFTTHLFRNLLPLSLHADLELGARSLHLPDPDLPASQANKSTARNKVNLQTTTVLLIRCLTSILIPPWGVRSVPPLRLASFAKQLMTTALHTPEKSTQAILALLADVGGTHGKKVAALWNTEERKGDGTYNALSESVEGANPFASTIWEGEILRRHYCPKVREGVKIVEKAFGNGGR
ncbi:hypothetical protein TruAng_001206 [Truncatella angustata]|nr:hypothetical protein TruAng_001206 [Truncatella angustata]